MKYCGKVIQKEFAKGSKSEREGIFISTDQGDEFLLRRKGGNPFVDKVLEGLVGKKIRCRGKAHDYTLIITEWQEVDE
jgi:hypothetical protein